jgi:DNA polymerase (family 10)
MTLDTKSASRALRKIASLLEVHGENPHRVRAFANAARAVEGIDGDLEAMVTSGDILETRGIGKGTAAVLTELADGLRPSVLVDLEEKTPEGVRSLLHIPGLGPKKVRSLWRDLEVTSPGELEYACRENRLVELPGFGAKSQQRLLEAAAFHRTTRERWLVHQAWAVAGSFKEDLCAVPGIARVEIAGELRRLCDTVEILDVVVVADEVVLEKALRNVCVDVKRVAGRLWQGRVTDGFPVRVRVTSEDQAGVALAFATGSMDHVEGLCARAANEGLRLDEDGLWSGAEPVTNGDEQRFYERLGCRWVAPELRENGDEVHQAAAGALPVLIEMDDVRGVLHNHTRDSDGMASIEMMGRAADDHGWSFLGIADHSPAAHYANGLSAQRLKEQWRRIDAFNATAPRLRIVKGLEADILGDGRLDIPDGCESGLEYVVASVHSSFRLDPDQQTERILTAVRHPACRVLGHPTGRLLLARPPYAVDLERILAACAECGVAVEINASPYRLDLDWRWARRAIELGVSLIINPDAHSIEGLDDVRWGLGVARKAGATPEHLVNCGDIDEWLNRRST